MGAMARTIRLLLLLALGTLLGVAIVKMRSSRAAHAGIHAGAVLPGSFDTWPDVPVKQST